MDFPEILIGSLISSQEGSESGLDSDEKVVKVEKTIKTQERRSTQLLVPVQPTPIKGALKSNRNSMFVSPRTDASDFLLPNSPSLRAFFQKPAKSARISFAESLIPKGQTSQFKTPTPTLTQNLASSEL